MCPEFARAAHLRAQAVLDRIEPAVEKQAIGLVGPSGRGMAPMAWSPARRSNVGNQGCEPRRLRHPKSNHLREGRRSTTLRDVSPAVSSELPEIS